MTEQDRLSELRSSARGWQGVQLAALGFIGLCGVLRSGSDTNPRWLQITAGVLILVALVLSCLATALVASAAWPLPGSGRGAETGSGEPHPAEVARTGRRLRLGIGATFVAVAVTALAAASSWWPQGGAEAALIQVSTSDSVACGELRDARPGVLALSSGGREVAFALSDVLSVRSVSACR